MYEKKNDYVIVFIVLVVVVFAAWLYTDSHRNDKQYNNTNDGLERIESRLSDIESRVDDLQKRNRENQKTVESISGTVAAGRDNAQIVAGGITEAEQRLDAAIQASGRIQNRITDIETKYR